MHIAKEKDQIFSWIKSWIGFKVSLYLINQDVKGYDTALFDCFTGAEHRIRVNFDKNNIWSAFMKKWNIYM